MILLRISAYLIFLLIIGVIWASYFSKIDIVTHASGKVVPFGKTRTIQNLEGGIVKEIRVLQGDRVAAGDIVIELEELASKSEVEELETRIVFLNTEIITLNGLISGKKVSYPDEYQRSYKNIVVASEENAQSQVKLLDSQISLQERMIENLNQSITIISEKMAEKKEMAKLLDKQIQISSDLLKEKLTSELEHLDLLRSRQGIKAELTELKRNIQSIDSEIQDAKSQIIVLKSEFNSNISSQIQKYTEEEQKYASRLQRFEDELGRRVVKSPVDGIIKQLFVSTIGGVVAPGMDIAEIVPSEESLVIEAELPVSDIGFVTVGQEALIRLAGTHSRYFQPIRGEVAVISPDTVKTEDGDTAYIVRLVTEEVQFSSREAKFNLYPGLMLDCSIVIGERSILLNIIAPLIDMKHLAMRENVWSNAELDSWQQHFANIFLPSRWNVEEQVEN